MSRSYVNRVVLVLLAAACVLCLAPAAKATLIQTNTAGIVTAFNSIVSSTDLVQAGSADVSSTSTTGNTPLHGGWAGLTDGAVDNYGNNKGSYWSSSDLYTWPGKTWNLNTAAHPTGYTLTSINSFYGYYSSTNYSNQAFDVAVSYVGAPTTFVQLAGDYHTTPSHVFVTYSGGNLASQVALTDTTGTLATGVAAIRVEYCPSAGGVGSVVGEFDVMGYVTPEPGTFALLAVGLVSLLAYAWRKRR